MAEAIQCERSAVAPSDVDVVYVRGQQTRLLPKGPAGRVTEVLREMDVLVAGLVHSASRTEFVKARGDVFDDYAHLQLIIASTFAMRGNRDIRRAAVDRALKGLKNFFAAEGTELLGEAPIREAMFSVDTLRRVSRVVDEIHSYGPAPEATHALDRELSGKYCFHAIWSQLHLDCLRLLIGEKSAEIDPEIVDEILQGLRGSVMAYSYARQGLDLRIEQPPQLAQPIELDDEDKELLNESFSDYEEHESNNQDA